ncbi:YggS family pyridoxal phosphate-dependent enzyme [Candidatus Magnetomonas plexicatena]|uniref:YggS family pyridoxal phosphate-dependent enzyme n=1 Tax=Candidatus Magnetomonas plexicatena TaxID=2552947 RepID=UPI001100AD76|nr:YggS family pyridoxal phosphate-dependent enzyme [Nitrospirales bacterium LBB_01]
MIDAQELARRISNINKAICNSSLKSDRNPDDVTLIAVSKYYPLELISMAIEAGVRDFGESYVKEGLEKIQTLVGHESFQCVRWHLLGHLQKNKAKKAVGVFDYIHSVDSVELAEIIDNEAQKLGKIQKVLIQPKLSDEDTKTGIDLDLIAEFTARIADMENVQLVGFMAIPPNFDNSESTRPYFQRLRTIRDEAIGRGHTSAVHLSMGMSDDYRVAIEEGATMVRVGSALFGPRQSN